MSATPAFPRTDDAEVIRQFEAALRARDIEPPKHILADGKLHRCDAVGRNGKSDASYILHLDGFPAGGFLNFRDGKDWENWKADIGRTLTPAEQDELRRKAEADRAQRDADEVRRRAEAASRAEAIWQRSLPCDQHLYLERKGVQPHGTKVSPRGDLVVPLRDGDSTLRSLQFIDGGGQKTFLPHGKVGGHYYAIGTPGEVFCVAEGFATSASVHEATGYAVAVAFDCGNLRPVAEAIRVKYPAAKIVIAADDDHLTRDKQGNLVNPGLTKAREAAAAVNGVVAIPVFGSDRSDGDNDFNDLARLAGAEAVKAAICKALDKTDAEIKQKDARESQTGEPGADAAEIARLARLPFVEYGRARKDAAMRLGCPVVILDKAVAAERTNDGAVTGQGRPLDLPAPEPWPQPVEGAAVLADVAGAIRRHVVLGAPEATAMALWVVASYAFDRFAIFPRLFVTSPEKQCGKTTLLDVLYHLLPKSIFASNITAASLFRVIEIARPTLLLDEADTFVPDNEELRGVLNAGHQRDGEVIRTVGDDHQPRRFSVFAPVALAAIGRLPGTIEDRSVIISLRRRRQDEAVEPLRLDRTGVLDELRRKAARWIADHAAELSVADPVMPERIFNRVADNWRPLLAIADLAGGEWPARARHAAAELTAGDDDQSIRTALLADIRAAFTTKAVDRLSSDELTTWLGSLEDRRWPEYRGGKPISKNQVARLLKPFEVSSGTIRLPDGGTPKGYHLSAFQDAFGRYLPPQNATPPQAAETLGIPAKSKRHISPSREDLWRFEIGQEPQKSKGCGVVAVQNPLSGEETHAMDAAPSSYEGADPPENPSIFAPCGVVADCSERQNLDWFEDTQPSIHPSKTPREKPANGHDDKLDPDAVWGALPGEEIEL